MPIPLGFQQHTSGWWMKASDQSGPYSFDGTVMVLGSPAAGAAGYPSGAVPVQSSSGNVANAAAVATLAAAAGKTTYCSGFEITSGGATAAAFVAATLAGIIGGTATYTVGVVAGSTLSNPALQVTFSPPIPASALNTAIVLTLPALGLGNTNATVSAHGFQL